MAQNNPRPRSRGPIILAGGALLIVLLCWASWVLRRAWLEYCKEAVAREQLRTLRNELGLGAPDSETNWFPLRLDEDLVTQSQSGEWIRIQELMRDPRTGGRFTYSPTNSLGERIRRGSWRTEPTFFVLWSDPVRGRRLVILDDSGIHNVEEHYLDFKRQIVDPKFFGSPPP